MGGNVFSFAANGFKVYYSFYRDGTGFTSPTWNGYSVGNLNEFTYTTAANEITITGYPKSASGPITIPATLDELPVVAIGNAAFQDCQELTSIGTPSGVTRIGDQAFQNCAALTSLTIPSGITSLGDQAFYGCAALTSMVIPSGMTSVPLGVFQDCGGLTIITIPSSVTSIQEFAFKGCGALTGVTIPANVTSIGDSAFQNCEGLESIKIPAGVTGIGGYAFAFCSGLTGVTIPSAVAVIGANAFFGCNGLTSLKISSGVTQIGSQAFYDCSSLASVVIPASVTQIGDEAFASCTSLSRVDFLGNAPTVGTDVFSDVATGFTVNHTKNATGFDSSPWTDFIVGVNNLPVANSRTVSTVKNTAVPVVITGKDPDGNALTYAIVTTPAKGKLTGTAPKLTYKPNKDISGTDSFTFTVSDGKVTSAPATVTITIGNASPLPWDSEEIGNGKLAGSTIYKSGIFTQAGAGGLGTATDKLRFTYQTLSGNGEIVAKVSALENTGNSSRVGVMIRETLATNSRQVFVGLSGTGVYRLMARTTKGGKNTTTNSSTGNVPNTWLRLVRKGTTVSAYQGTNGTKWTLIDTVEVALDNNCYIGLAVASGSDTKLNTSQFSNVKVKP